MKKKQTLKKLELKKMQIAKISNPKIIIGGNQASMFIAEFTRPTSKI